MTERRPISEQQHDWLTAQLRSWGERGLVNQDQAHQILALYETSQQRQERRRSWLLYTLAALAVVLFGAAALLLVGYNWAAMPWPVKLLVVFATIVATYSLGVYLRYWQGARLASDIVLLLGCFFYGAGIWLVAQIFHMSAHYPDGVFWWALGVLPLAILVDSLAIHALLVALVALWCGMEMTQFSHFGALLFGRRWPIPNGCYQVLLMALPGLGLAYRTNSFWRVALYVPLLAWWATMQSFAWQAGTSGVYFAGAVGALLLVIAESHAPGSQLAIPYRAYGALVYGSVLLPLSSRDFYCTFWSSESPAPVALGTMAAILIVSAAILGVAEWLRYRCLEQGQPTAAARIDDMRRRQWLPLCLTVLMAVLSLWSVGGNGFYGNPRESLWLPLLAANTAIVVLSLWLISVGLREERGLPFAAGVLYFLLWTVIRYIDLFGEVGGMLGASLMFFLCGCVLLGVALFWRNRKRVQYA